MAIADQAKIKALLGITGAAKDALIDEWIPVVEDQIEMHTRRTFNKVLAAVERHNGRNSRFVYPRRTPILAVISLNIIDPTDGSIVEAFTAADFEIKGSGPQSTGEFIELVRQAGFVNRGHFGDIGFPAGTNNIELTLDAGYDDLNMPPRVQGAMALQINTYINSNTRPNGMESEAISKYRYKRAAGPGGKAIRSGLIPEAAAMLASFVRPVIEFAGTPESAHEVRRLRP